MTAETQATTFVEEDNTGRRIVAWLIDAVLMIIVYFVMLALFGESETSTDDSGFSVSFNLSGIWAIIYFVIFFGYYTYFEGTTGQTVGKKVMGIRVVALDGSMTILKALIRSLMRIVDAFPWLIPYLLGLILVITTKKHQRLGDMVAGTGIERIRPGA